MKGIFRHQVFLLTLFLVLAWGLTFPIYKITLTYTPPLLFAGIRGTIAGLLMSVLLLPRWKQIRWSQYWPIYLITGCLNTLLFYGFQTVGLSYMPSGLFSVIVYLQPVLLSIFAWLWLGESLTLLKIAGLILGFSGVAIVSIDGLQGQDISMIGIILSFATAISWAFGVVYVKKVILIVHVMWLVALQSLIGGVLLTGFGLVIEDWSSIVWNMPYFAGLLYGIVFGVLGAFYAYFKLVSLGEVSKVASYTFFVPFIALVLGTWLLDEPISIFLLIGFIFIAMGIYLVNKSTKKVLHRHSHAR